MRQAAIASRFQLRMPHEITAEITHIQVDAMELVRMVCQVRRDNELFAVVEVRREGRVPEEQYRAYHAIRFRNGDWPELQRLPPFRHRPVPTTQRHLREFALWLYEPYQ